MTQTVHRRTGARGAIAGFALLAALPILGGCNYAPPEPPPQRVAEPVELPVPAGTLPDVAVSPERTTRESAELTGRAWYVTTVRDPGTRSYTAAVERRSVEEISFDTPYDGEQRPSITVVLHDGRPADLVLSIERGRFVCGDDSHEAACAVRVSIDDCVPRQVRFAVPRHDPGTRLHLAGGEDARRLLAALVRAKRMRVQPTFQQQRSPEIEFALAGLNPAIARIVKRAVAATPATRGADAGA